MRAIKDRLIIALDLPSLREAERIVEAVETEVGYFKVGLQLFTAAGPPVIQFLKRRGLKVFLDLKFHDIPHTVSQAGIEAVKQGVDMFDLHAVGGLEMMKQCRERCTELADREGLPLPQILGITVLTSTEQSHLPHDCNSSLSLPEQVSRLSNLVKAAGLHGVVTSPLELQDLRQKHVAPFLLVAPGIRPSWSEPQDQKRFATPAQALQWGADYLVIGRPVLESSNPLHTVQRLLQEMENPDSSSSPHQKLREVKAHKPVE
jgi:orotidine-5'-phosphate decarboxylase